MKPFKYAPLDSDRDYIRLIEFCPAPKRRVGHRLRGIRVTCELKHVLRAEAPPYAALSYVWGSDENPPRIAINGCVMRVTANLECALEALSSKVTTPLWVDALCINQADDAEKSEQVKQMANLYSQATNVICWLGPEADNSHRAMALMQEHGQKGGSLGRHQSDDFNEVVEEIVKTVRQSWWTEGDFGRHLHDFMGFWSYPANVHALRALFRRDYWARRWIVQEVLLPSRAEFVCGNDVLQRSDLIGPWGFVPTLLGLYNSQTHIRNFTHLATDDGSRVAMSAILSRTEWLWTEMPRLIDLLDCCAECQTTNPSDRIYALSGLAKDWNSMGLDIDYSKPTTELYVETARALLAAGYVQIFGGSGYRWRSRQMASWVPDWSGRDGPTTFTFIPHSLYAASGTLPVDSEMIRRGANTTAEGTAAVLEMPSIRVGEIIAIDQAKVRNYSKVFAGLKKLWTYYDVCRDDPTHWPDMWRVPSADLFQGTQGFQRMSSEQHKSIHESLSKVNDREIYFGDPIFQKDELVGYHGALEFRRDFIALSNGSIGMAATPASVGFEVFIFKGFPLPLILEPVANKSGSYRFHGEAYIHGIMDGEVVDKDTVWETITIV